MKKPLLLALAAMALVLLYVAPAYAGTGGALLGLGDDAITAIAGAATALFGWLLHTKIKNETVTKNSALLDEVIKNAIGYAAQLAHKKLKASEPAMAASEKLGAAIGYADDMIKHHKLPALAKDKLGKLIESKLGSVRPH